MPRLGARGGRRGACDGDPMSESRTSSPPVETFGELDELLDTKLAIPRTREKLLPRSRLIEALDEESAGRVILVCTPAGFGKTTLLADWAGLGEVAGGLALIGSGGQRSGAVLPVHDRRAPSRRRP